jgi:hypothetical protein
MQLRANCDGRVSAPTDRKSSRHHEWFSEEVRSDDPEFASYLRIEERELEIGGMN